MMEKYIERIESLKNSKASDKEWNDFIEELAWDDDLTNDEYSSLYEIIMNEYKGMF